MIQLHSENRSNGLSYIDVTDPAGAVCGSFSLATPDWKALKAQLIETNVQVSEEGDEGPAAEAPSATPAPKRQRKPKE